MAILAIRVHSAMLRSWYFLFHGAKSDDTPLSSSKLKSQAPGALAAPGSSGMSLWATEVNEVYKETHNSALGLTLLSLGSPKGLDAILTFSSMQGIPQKPPPADSVEKIRTLAQLSSHLPQGVSTDPSARRKTAKAGQCERMTRYGLLS